MDTIAAISTPMGEGGISVIRVSGPDAITAADRIFASKSKLAEASSHTVHYGHIRDASTGERIDEVLVTVMRAPRSFTMEDVVEIGCHGGMVSVKKTLDTLLSSPEVRLAEPGEFTKRAFLNGRIDLAQAEAVIDLIRAKSDKAFSIALKQVEGTLSKKIGRIRFALIELMAHIEVNIDYPEHDVESLTNAFIKDKCAAAILEVEGLLKAARQGKLIREGIETAIVGSPNVGKSSLLNALAQQNRAIVTDIPGTTRDVIEEYVTIAGIPLKLLDTAGIRETSDVVERIGVERSKAALAEADLILLVLDGSRLMLPEERELLSRLRERQLIVIVNKSDLPQKLDLAEVREMASAARLVELSALEENGLESLEKAIADMFFSGSLEAADLTYVSNVRHIQLLKAALASLEEAVQAAELLTPIDMIQIDIRTAWEKLGEVIGDSAPDSLLDQIFSQFCLGK